MWPWSAARTLFGQDRDPARYPELARARSAVGLVVVLVVHLDAGSVRLAIDDALDDLLPKILIGLAVVVLAIAVVVVAADSPAYRAQLLRNARPAITSFVAAGVVGAGALWLNLSGEAVLTRLHGVVLALVVVVPIWASFFLPFAAWYVTRYWMRVGEVHPMLLPIVAAVMVTVSTVPELGDGGSVGLSPTAELLVGLGGWLTTLALCAAEYLDLWRAGFRLRCGVRRAPWPPRW